MSSAPKPPPRFVPTLTDVVREDEAGHLRQEPALHSMTQPVTPSQAAAPTVKAVSTPSPVMRELPPEMEEHLVHRVMQRVDLVLDQRLRESIATVVQEQTRSMLPRLREEVESVVRQSVYEAVADELATEQAQHQHR